jgi:hypothetical protein
MRLPLKYVAKGGRAWNVPFSPSKQLIYGLLEVNIITSTRTEFQSNGPLLNLR